MKKQDFIFKWVVYPHGVDENGDKALFKGFISINRRTRPSPSNQPQSDDFRQNLKQQNIKNVNQILRWIHQESNPDELSSDDNSGLWLWIANDGDIKKGPLLTKETHNTINVFGNIEVPDSFNGLTAEKVRLNGDSFLSVQSDEYAENEKDKNIKDINEDEYDRILNQGREYAIKNADQFQNDQTFNLITFYGKLLEEPMLAEKLGLIHEFYLPLSNSFFEKWGEKVKYDLSSNIENPVPDKDLPFGLYIQESASISKYYNGFFNPFLEKSYFKSVNVAYGDDYKKNLNSKNVIEGDGIYVNVQYLNNDDPFEKKNIFGYNVLLSKQKKNDGNQNFRPRSLQSLSLLKREYLIDNKVIATDISSGYLLPKPTLQVSNNEEYRTRLLFVWKGENLALNRVKRNRTIKPSEEEFDHVLTKNNDDGILNTLLDFNFKVKESFIPETNPHLEASNDIKYFFYLRPVTGLNYYLETKEEWCLKNPGREIPKKILFFEDFILKESVHKKAVLVKTKFPKFKVDAPVLIAKEVFDNENTPFVDSKNSMVVNLKEKEKSEYRFLYPPRTTWEKFKMLGYLNKQNVSNEINQYARRCIRLEKRSLKDIRRRQGVQKKINYLADPRAKKIEIIPNDLFTVNFFAENLSGIYELDEAIFELKERYPYYSKAKGAKVEAKRTGSTNILTIQDKVFLEDIPLGAYFVKLRSKHSDNDIFSNENKVLEKNGEVLNFAFIDRPNKPATDLENLNFSRFQNGDNNKWKLSYKIIKKENKNFATKSIKFYEETSVLKLQHEKLNELLNEFEEDLSSYDLFDEEYPVELFIKKEGSLNDNLKTCSFPEKVECEFRLQESLCSGNQELFRMKLSELDEIVVVADEESNCLKLWHNRKYAKFKKDDEFYQIKFSVEYDGSLEKFILNGDDTIFYELEGTELDTCDCSILEKEISPEISIRDVEVADKIEIKNFGQVNGLEFFSQTFLNNKISVKRLPQEIILKDEGHPFYRKKTIKLFASSAFQGFFPKTYMEKDIGSIGQEFDFEILNNVKPEKPELETDLLLYSHQQKSWGTNNQISEERSFLVRITFDQAFMKEGIKNKFAIILGEYTDASFKELVKENSEKSSVIGEDITKLIGKGVIDNNNIESYIDLNPKRKELEKYFFKNVDETESNLEAFLRLTGKVKKVNLGNHFYKLLITQPYYNVSLRKWQIILSFKDFRKEFKLKESYEAIFIKLMGFKVSPGLGLNEGNSEHFIIKNELNQTIVSDLTEPKIIPIYNRKKYILERKGDHLKIINKGHRKEEKNKLYVLTKLKTRTKGNMFIDIDGGTFSSSEHIELTESNFYSFPNDNYREIVIREFEKHDNYDETNTNFSRFPIKGLRLINYVQFKI